MAAEHYYLVLLFLCLLQLSKVKGSYPNVYRPLPSVPLQNNADVGEPLFLTPLIESGNITQAQTLAEVKLSETPDLKSYAGYLTVNKQYNSNLFFWFFPALNNNENAPVVVWLQGGPGASSLYGLFTENGPLQVFKTKKSYKLKIRKYTWSLNHSVIYIDNPVGAGYSFTDSEDGYAVSQTDVGNNLYIAILQFFQLFPNLQKNSFFVSGESYAGKYVPAFAYTIHKNNPSAKLKVNLEGLAIGNGFSDPLHQLVYGDYLYQLGLLDMNGRDMFKNAEAETQKRITNKDWNGAYDYWNTVLDGDGINGSTIFTNLTGFNFYFNYLHSNNYMDDNWSKWVQNDSTRKCIHVGNKTFNVETQHVEDCLKSDVFQSVAPWIAELLAHYRVLIYNGQLDIIVAYPLTVNYLSNLNFSAAEQYKTAARRLWYCDGNLAGYSKVAGNLTEVLVRNAGHMVPADQPKFALDMISRFTSGQEIY